jgi:hypothetical protein
MKINNKIKKIEITAENATPTFSIIFKGKIVRA